MRAIKIPYYKGNIDCVVPEQNLMGVLYSNADSYVHDKEGKDIVRKAIEEPIDSTRLRAIVKDKKNLVLITSDHTRPVPSKITLPILLEEIRSLNSRIDITILVATGLHRAPTYEEMIDKYGKDVVENEKIVVHDAFREEDMVRIGRLPSGRDCKINRLALDADVLICEGFIEPHFFAGYSGGRKSILPGIASQETVNANHSARAIASDMAKTGILEGNPIHEDMVYAARQAGVDFILNVVLDSEKQIIHADAGDLESAHINGCNFLADLCGVKAKKADIVITSNGGYPLDQNLYQCPKAISAAVECANDDGVIIMVASCIDGLGGENFGKLMLLNDNPRETLDYILSIPDEETISEQWCVQKFAEIILSYNVILVSEYLDPEIVKRMNIIPAMNISDALSKAFDLKGKDASITVIPDGVSVIVN